MTPRHGDNYYIPTCFGGRPNWCPFIWTGSATDLDRLAAGLVCLTSDEALERADVMIAYMRERYADPKNHS